MVVVKGDQKFSGTEAVREFCLGKKRLFNQSNLPKELTDQSAAMQVKIDLKIALDLMQYFVHSAELFSGVLNSSVVISKLI